jgi:hypothetical protein
MCDPGGVISHIYGGNFWQGFGQGAASAAAGFLFNECVKQLSIIGEDWSQGYPQSIDTANGTVVSDKDIAEGLERTQEEHQQRFEVIRDIGKHLAVEGVVTSMERAGIIGIGVGIVIRTVYYYLEFEGEAGGHGATGSWDAGAHGYTGSW